VLTLLPFGGGAVIKLKLGIDFFKKGRYSLNNMKNESENNKEKKVEINACVFQKRLIQS
jgi:hypothetical protein